MRVTFQHFFIAAAVWFASNCVQWRVDAAAELDLYFPVHSMGKCMHNADPEVDAGISGDGSSEFI